MGRQAYLTRLAFGRSPYGEPIRDENGDLFLGLRTYDDAAKDYVQQHDERGRLINPDTEATNRKLRRAQNEVLRIAGVVRKRSEAQPQRPFQLMTDERRLKLLVEENSYADNVKVFSGVFQEVACWWLQTLRKRLFVGLNVAIQTGLT
jgi:hypothetical protein